MRWRLAPTPVSGSTAIRLGFIVLVRPGLLSWRGATDTGRHNGRHGAIPSGVAPVRADPAEGLRLAWALSKALGADCRDRSVPRQVRRRAAQVQVPLLDVRV